MSRETELYRLELEEADKIFGKDTFLSISQLAKRTGVSWDTMRRLFAGHDIPPTGISKARYALALSQRCTTYHPSRKRSKK